ncbi:MAG: IS3 family transposase [Actinomycetota bacterium]|nr:IS3 family transposase [Actinomycetota bacterium]
MGTRRVKYSPEFKDEAVRMVIDGSRPIADVARELSVHDGTLGNWVNKYRDHHPVEEPPLTVSERIRLRELEAEVRELRMRNEFLGKAARPSSPGSQVSSKYEFIDGEKANYPIVKMCRWAEVSKSGFYEWRGRPASATAERRAGLRLRIVKIFADADGASGYRRVHAQLERDGVEAGPELVRQIMAVEGLVACQPRPFRVTTLSDGIAVGPADLCQRDFTAEAPGVKLVGDITYVRTWDGWVYLATVIDCCTRMVVGYALGDHMRTSLVIDALAMARRNVDLVEGCIFHSDRGTQYTSAELTSYLKVSDLRGSMGRRGQCWDNALAESFFAALKNEFVYRTVFPTRGKAMSSIASWIEIRYNRKRLHSGIGYRTPLEAHQSYVTQQAVA